MSCSLLFCPCSRPSACCFFFFFNDTATTEIYTLSLHDALPISSAITPRRTSTRIWSRPASSTRPKSRARRCRTPRPSRDRSEEHTSELQSQSNLVCRLLLEKKKALLRNASPSGLHPRHTRRLLR